MTGLRAAPLPPAFNVGEVVAGEYVLGGINKRPFLKMAFALLHGSNIESGGAGVALTCCFSLDGRLFVPDRERRRKERSTAPAFRFF